MISPSTGSDSTCSSFPVASFRRYVSIPTRIFLFRVLKVALCRVADPFMLSRFVPVKSTLKRPLIEVMVSLTLQGLVHGDLCDLP